MRAFNQIMLYTSILALLNIKAPVSSNEPVF